MPHRAYRKIRVFDLFRIIALCFVLIAGVVHAADLKTTVLFDIEAQPLTTALIELSKQAHVQVMSSAADLKTLAAPAVKGRFTVGEALDRLLGGTGLHYTTTADHTIAIRSDNSPAHSSSLDTARDTRRPVAAAPPDSRYYDIAAGDLDRALKEFGVQSGVTVVAPTTVTAGKKGAAVRGDLAPADALGRLLKGSGLTFARAVDGTIAIQAITSNGPAAQASAAESGLDKDLTSRQGKLDEILVTGSRLRGVPLASPVVTLDRQYLLDEGVVSIQGALANVPQNLNNIGLTNVLTPSPGAYNPTTNNSGGGSSPNLRGLGPSATLSLLNGERLPVASQGFSADLSLIPLLAVERIDVLTDGAAPLYGSDAIAGVVNVITRKAVDGFESSLRYGQSAAHDASQIQFGQMFGTTWRDGSALLAYQYDDQRPLSSVDRKATSELSEKPDVIPDQIQHSIYANWFQSINDETEIGLEDSYGRRENLYRWIDSQMHLPSSSGSVNTQNLLTASLVTHFSDAWRGTSYVRYASGGLDFRLSQPGQDLGQIADYFGRQLSAGAVIDGKLFSLPSGPVNIAVGVDYSHEHRTLGGANVYSGPLSSLSSGFSYDLSRTVEALFGEVNLPLVAPDQSIPMVRSLNLSVAGRYDHYSDVGDTVNPRIGLVWEITDQLRARGTYSTSFRAPSVGDRDNSALGSFTALFPDAQTPGGQAIVLYVAGATKPGVKPETARNSTFGLDFEPAWLANSALHLTYFNISYRGRLSPSSAGVQDIFDFTDPVVEQLIARSPSAATVAPFLRGTNYADYTGLSPTANQINILIDDRVTNLASTQTSGLDLAFEHSDPLFGGTLNSRADLSYVRTDTVRATPSAPALSVVGDVYFPARFRGRVGSIWKKSGWSASAFVNYVSPFDDNQGSTFYSVSSWTTVDLNGSYAFQAPSGPLHDFSVSLAVTNVLNSAPPYITSPAPETYPFYDAANASIIGRFISLEARKKW
jgi:iron complex outermembrane recepter protein